MVRGSKVVSTGRPDTASRTRGLSSCSSLHGQLEAGVLVILGKNLKNIGHIGICIHIQNIHDIFCKELAAKEKSIKHKSVL